MQDLGSDAGRLARALEDAKAFNKGKGRILVFMIALGCALVFFFAWFLLAEQPNPYSALGKQANGLKTQYFDAFWACALPGKVVSEVKSDADLRGELDVRAVAGARYGAQLRECLKPMENLSVSLGALMPPDDAAIHVKNMASGAAKVSLGAKRFAVYLASVEGEYDADNAARESDMLVRGWYEFRKAHADLNVLLRAHLGR